VVPPRGSFFAGAFRRRGLLDDVISFPVPHSSPFLYRPMAGWIQGAGAVAFAPRRAKR
jgi:hypothetical protein